MFDPIKKHIETKHLELLEKLFYIVSNKKILAACSGPYPINHGEAHIESVLRRIGGFIGSIGVDNFPCDGEIGKKDAIYELIVATLLNDIGMMPANTGDRGALEKLRKNHAHQDTLKRFFSSNTYGFNTVLNSNQIFNVTKIIWSHCSDTRYGIQDKTAEIENLSSNIGRKHLSLCMRVLRFADLLDVGPHRINPIPDGTQLKRAQLPHYQKHRYACIALDTNTRCIQLNESEEPAKVHKETKEQINKLYTNVEKQYSELSFCLPGWKIQNNIDLTKWRIPSVRQKKSVKKRVKKSKKINDANCIINPYKLFYYMSQTHEHNIELLSEELDLPVNLLKNLQVVKQNENASFLFPVCKRQDLEKLEAKFNCYGVLEAGKRDDLLTKYIIKYESSHERIYKGKAIIFDFDGTLAHSRTYKSTWQILWEELGYKEQECHELHRRYEANEFSHQEWCNITCQRFIEKKCSQQNLHNVAKKLVLVDGFNNVIEKLHSDGVKMYIASGSIHSIINEVLGESIKYFDEIKANKMVFGDDGILCSIIGTTHDFEGKADFATYLMEKIGLFPLEVLFVGDSNNDRFVSCSGARTLCVNKGLTNPYDGDLWTYYMPKMSDLSEILRFLDMQ